MKFYCQITSIFSLFFLLAISSNAQEGTILMFVSYDQTYYTEYIVMKNALEASGYSVDVRSAQGGHATTYLVGQFSDQAYPNYYPDFKNQYAAMFGQPWSDADTTLPLPGIALDGSLLDVSGMDGYKALVIAGGTGVNDYRIDGTYGAQRDAVAHTIQASAQKLNDLALEALVTGKPVIAQCHGASLPAFWRVPGTLGSGFDNLGISLLQGKNATGYPDGATSTYMFNLGINYHPSDPVILSSPSSSLNYNPLATSKLGTSRDWYPFTVAHTAMTLINAIETFPSQLSDSIRVLILHGGTTNCGTGDIPCNHGNTGENIPADFHSLDTLLTANSLQDDFTFLVDDVDLILNHSNAYAFDENDECRIRAYFSRYDVLIFFKHWALNLTPSVRAALVNYADKGGGIVCLHHGLYDQAKIQVPDSLFLAVSPSNGWSGVLANIQYFSTNYGHFTSTHGIDYPTDSGPSPQWTAGNQLKTGSNFSLSNYKYFTIYDELYGNMQFRPYASFGKEINQIPPLFSNGNILQANVIIHQHVQAFTRKFTRNPADGSVGKLVFAQSGERKANFRLPSNYAQFIRNATYWAGYDVHHQFESKSWVQNASGNWNQASNWSGNVLPGPCHNVSIDPMSPVDVNVPVSLEIEINELYLGPGNHLILPANSILRVKTY